MALYTSPSPYRSRSVTPMTPQMSKLMPQLADQTISNSMTKSLGHAQPIFNSARQQMYSRYAHNEWESSNKNHFSLSDRERSLGEKIRSDAWRVVKATDQRTRNRQSSNTKKLNERVSDITFWKDELVAEMRAMDNEIDNLQEHKRVLEKAYHDTKTPLSISEECLLQREKRQGIDMVHDDVERSLNHEVSLIKKCQDRMRKMIEKAHIQLKMNRAAQHACDRDSKDKFHAQNLDDRMQQLRNSSGGLSFYPGIENVDNTQTVPFSWVRFTQENIARSQKEREASEKLRGAIDALLRECANNMWSQFNTVNNAFNTRVQETTDAKNKLQGHLQRVCGEIRDMERNISLLAKAIHDKEAPLKVAQTRLDERTRRIHVEICNDNPMNGLQQEVHEIRDSVKMLQQKLRESENALVRLNKTKGCLEHDIGVKENSLMLDNKACMGMRRNMAMDPKVGPVFSMPMI